MKSQKISFRGMSRSHLFLIELIIVILFFAFAGAVTVQVFAKAHELARDAEALNGAILAVQSAAETDKAAPLGGIVASREPGTFSGAGIPQDPGISSGAEISRKPVYFDADWKVTDPAGAVYTLTSEVALEERPAGVMAVYHYTAAYEEAASPAYAEAASPTSGNKIIYELDTKKYYPKAMISGSAAPGNASASEVD